MFTSAIYDMISKPGILKKHWSYDLLLRIKHRFGVFAEVFLYRLNELDLIGPFLIEPWKSIRF
jgi:Zn-dependent peptidase ImmA (M78 family)